MNTLVIFLFGALAFFFGYRAYSRLISDRVYHLQDDLVTPAHEFEDGIDYVPTRKGILWGHHFTSVAGAAPIVGPAIAVIWGWLPALLWVVLGTVFAAGVHDSGALMLSVRHKARSIGSVAQEILGPRTKLLYLIIILLLLLMVNAVFAMVIGILFVGYPGSVLPVAASVIIALVLGQLLYRKKMPAFWPSIVALILLYIFIGLGQFVPIRIDGLARALGMDPVTAWVVVLFIYTYFAVQLPVWRLLQPRDYINGHQLIVGLAIVFLGVMLLHPQVSAPVVNFQAPGSPNWIPFLFITIACGAISGFHSLVASGTTAKQLDQLKDARPVGYGAAIGEGFLALSAILAAGISVHFAGEGSLARVVLTPDGSDWMTHYADWNAASGLGAKVGAYIKGVAYYASGIGIPAGIGSVFASVIVISFAATTMDTGVRLQKYVLQEFGEMYRLKFLQSHNIASLVAVLMALGLAVREPGGKGALIIWPLFGTSNQLLAGLALLTITVWLRKQRYPIIYTVIPMVFVLVMTIWAMLINLQQYLADGKGVLITFSLLILLGALWIIWEGSRAFRASTAEVDHVA
ncbi:MAG: carbon starvation protein A [Candidatus Neomarinimicrobiota bacterium]|nr:MAG: carbon starvation protein A [Candidatus Neomarinimicrobiota bacterium]